MSPLLLLILELPASVLPRVDGLAQQGEWREPSALADAALASVLTGVAVDTHGVLNEFELRPDGQALRPAPRYRLMHAPLWERVEGAVAVGLPWSTGSRAGKCVVSPEFVGIGVPGPQTALPDRVWPAAFGAQLAAACIAPEELDPSTLAQLGFATNGTVVQNEVAGWLSLHAIGTALLEDWCPPLLIVRLRLALEPANPTATAHFVEAMLDRYRSLWGDDELRLLICRPMTDAVEYSAFGSEPGLQFDSAMATGFDLAKRLGLPLQSRPLPKEHWAALRARYQPPNNTLPGSAAQVLSLRASVDAALTVLQGLE